MALRGNFSQSFLRSKELLSFSEISYDKEGKYIYDKGILKEALARDESGQFIRNKVNIARILNNYGILYRMVFNAMNMDQYTYTEVQEALEYLSEYINELGVSGIVEFHASDKTQNSDHIHFWISTEDKLIYNKIAKEMVSMGYSNEEDIYIQKYENNKQLDEKEYVNDENRSLNDRFSIQAIEKKEVKILSDKEPSFKTLSSLQNQYNSIVNNINNLLQKEEDFNNHSNDSFNNKLVLDDCTLAKTGEINRILKRIKELQNGIN
jgi:hypothetical protein